MKLMKNKPNSHNLREEKRDGRKHFSIKIFSMWRQQSLKAYRQTLIWKLKDYDGFIKNLKWIEKQEFHSSHKEKAMKCTLLL